MLRSKITWWPVYKDSDQGKRKKKDQSCPVKWRLALKYLQRSNPNLWPRVNSSRYSCNRNTRRTDGERLKETKIPSESLRPLWSEKEKKDQSCPVKWRLALKYLQRSNPNLWPRVNSSRYSCNRNTREDLRQKPQRDLFMPVKYRLINLVRKEKRTSLAR